MRLFYNLMLSSMAFSVCMDAAFAQETEVVRVSTPEELYEACNRDYEGGRGLITLEGPSGMFINPTSGTIPGGSYDRPYCVFSGNLILQFNDPLGDPYLIQAAGSEPFPFAQVLPGGSLTTENLHLVGFGNPNGVGGTIIAEADSHLALLASGISDSNSAGGGGAASIDGSFFISDSSFVNNNAGTGGAFRFGDNATGIVERSIFNGNGAENGGCDIFFDQIFREQAMADILAWSRGNVLTGPCDASRIVLDGNGFRSSGNTMSPYGFGIQWRAAGINPSLSGPQVENDNSFYYGIGASLPFAVGDGKSKPKTDCENATDGVFTSLGYNITEDDSCGFDQPTDLVTSDPMVAEDDNGIPTPQPGSPLIDHGASDVMVRGSDSLASLPCSFVDVNGTGRPQDGDDNGVFECDAGAVEVTGRGEVVTAHSGPFFNTARDGEGTYVEILGNGLALVYTFTYRPGGLGPAWFLGVGPIRDNAIVIYDMRRPVGASFGEAFDRDDIVLERVGGMSMVFPDCDALDEPGNVAYSGNPDTGFEALITTALRLGYIDGCGAQTPSIYAGLSGSYFDLERDGEGIVVEWLTNGQVLVVFFTYDLDGEQMWLIGIGTPDGDSVTMDALYPAIVTSWGRDFDAAEISIETWGTFTLDWAGRCTEVDFSYDSIIEGYGSSQRSYISLSKLAGTTCP